MSKNNVLNTKLERYLFELEEGLRSLTPSDRAKIIHETNEHILEQTTKFPEKDLQSILDDLGEPIKLANHYRLDRGQSTLKVKKFSLVRWISLTILGGMGLFFLFITFLIIKFSPLFHFDEKKNHLILLGGLIDIDASQGKLKVFDQYQFVSQNKFINQFNGQLEISPEEYDELIINFNHAYLTIESSGSNELMWQCQLEKPPQSDFIGFGKDAVDIDLEITGGAECTLSIPINIKLSLSGMSGEITLDAPEFHSFVELEEGNIFFKTNTELEYSFDTSVSNGELRGKPVSSQSDNAYEVNIMLGTGLIHIQ